MRRCRNVVEQAAGYLLLLTVIGVAGMTLSHPPNQEIRDVSAADVRTLLSHHTLAQISRTSGQWLAGYATGVSAGIVAGALFGLSRFADRIGRPTYAFLRFIPVVVTLHVLRPFFKYERILATVLVGWTAAWIMTLVVAHGLQGMDKAQVERAICLGWSPQKRFFLIHIRWLSEFVAAGLEQAATACFLVTITVEMFLPHVIGREGIGSALYAFDFAPGLRLLYAGLSGVIGIALALIARTIGRLLPKATTGRY